MKKLFGILIIGGLIVLLPIVVGFGKTGRNTRLLDKDYSLLEKKEIVKKIEIDFPNLEKLIFEKDGRRFVLNMDSISAEIDSEKTASGMLYRRLNKGLGKYVEAFFFAKSFALEYKYDEEKLNREIEKIETSINKPFVPTEILLENGKIIVKQGQLGEEIKIEEFRKNIFDNLENYRLGKIIEIPTEIVGSLPDDKQVELAKGKAEKIKGKMLEINATGTIINIDDKTLISWVSFEESCGENKIKDYLESIRQGVEKEPINAVFKFENGKVLEFKSATDGQKMNIEKSLVSICTKLDELMDSKEQLIKIDLPMDAIAPKIKNEDVNNLGIKDLLGRGISTFKHSSVIRNINVEKGASIINNILVKPGETFSFVENLGEVSLEAGFKKAYIIKQGKTELDVGGGVCQVSTTFFRAILNAGLNITERKAHAYRVSYYEEDSLPGYDATVFIPKPDLKFVNDTGNNILIQNVYDGKNKKLIYEIYGTSDGRKTEISNYRKWGAAPAPPDVNIEDPSLPLGKVVQDEHAIPGLKVSFDWKVTKNGETLYQKTFQSSYVPWAAVYRRGTGTN